MLESAVVLWSSWAVAVTWQLAALAVIAWVCEKAFRLRQPRVRHALWWFALVAPVLLAPGRMALARRQAVVRVSPPAVVGLVAQELQPLPRRQAPEVQPLPGPGAGAEAPALRSPVRPAQVAALAWALGCALLAARLVVGHARARRLVRESRAVTDERALGALAELCAEAGVRRQVRLRVSASVGAPVLYGVRRPTILLPAEWLDSLAPDELEALLAHEVAHVKRRDCLANFAQRLIEIPPFFHPGAWLASRRITLAREELADAWALARGVEASSYARFLAAAAERTQARLSVASVGVAEGRSTLLRRVEAIMRGGSPKRLSRPLVTALAALVLVSAAAFAAVEFSAEKLRSQAGADGAEQDREVRIELAREGVIEGEVVLPGPARQPGASVQVLATDDRTRSVVGPAITDQRGRYRLTGLAAGSYHVWTWDEQWSGKIAQLLIVAAGQRVSAPTIVLARNGRVAGRVLDAETDLPVAGARVRCSAWGDSEQVSPRAGEPMLTEPDGRYLIATPPGEAVVRVEAPPEYMFNYHREEKTVAGKRLILITFDDGSYAGALVEVKAGETTPDINVWLRPAAGLAGVAVRPDGEPWRDQYVFCSPDWDQVVLGDRGPEVMPARVNRDGTFHHSQLVPDLPYVLTAHDETEKTGRALRVTTTRGLTTGLRIELLPLVPVAGRVLFPDGTPAAMAEVSPPFIYGPVRCDENGRFEVTGATVGLPNRIVAALPSWRGHSEAFEVTPGQQVAEVGDIVLREAPPPPSGTERPGRGARVRSSRMPPPARYPAGRTPRPG